MFKNISNKALIILFIVALAIFALVWSSFIIITGAKLITVIVLVAVAVAILR